MNTKIKVLIGAVGVIGITAGVYAYKKKQRNKGSIEFLEELEKFIDPGGAGLNSSDAFDIYYWEKAQKEAGKPIVLLKKQAAHLLAKDIRDSWSVINDDEEKVYSAFRALKDKVQVSMLAKAYYDDYKVNLIDELNNRMDKDTEVKIINMIVRKLPKWRLVEDVLKKK